MRDRNSKSLRTEFLGFFVISLVASMVFGMMSYIIVENLYFKAKQDIYETEKQDATALIEELKTILETDQTKDGWSDKLDALNFDTNIYFINVVDEQGTILYRSHQEEPQQRDYILYRALNLNGENKIVFLEGLYKDRPYEESVLVMVIILMSVILFIFVFFRLANNRINYIHEISETVGRISKGDLDSQIRISGQDELTWLAGNINMMGQSIRERNAIEEKMEKSKKELITNMAHDLSTPLTSIIGYLNLIKDRKYPDESKLVEYVEICFNKSQQLKQLISKLFEYSKLTSEAIKLEKTNLDVNRLIDQVKVEYFHLIEDNHLQLELDLNPEKPFIYADPILVVRVFENLIHNAIKYAKKPGILRIKSIIENDDVLVTFSNNIDRKQFKNDDMKRIFERMYIKDQSRSQGSGSGLGLAISREMVELNGGKIWSQLEDDQIVFIIRFRNINSYKT
ncbi:MAG: HAMP domain-containing sensor histidine kinase [Eubacteriales bacterium]|nr:HAMP domain-containing sensor histidine kinase [Eubacteriales bacterium]